MESMTVNEYLCTRVKDETGHYPSEDQLDAGFMNRFYETVNGNCSLTDVDDNNSFFSVTDMDLAYEEVERTFI